jgi:hypothetical protein
MRRRKTNRRAVDYNIGVFINCPFDSKFKPIFDCIVFTVVLCGFRARCALEIDDGSQTRIEKIFAIIEQCRLGIHDLSRTELDRVNRLPRFNMPLELGMFLGVKRGGASLQRRKTCLVLDRERYRFQKFISDIAGQDIRSHNFEQRRAISAVRDWLGASSGKILPGGAEIFRQYRRFMKELPILCRKVQIRQSELTFADFLNFSTEWLKRELPVPTVS